MKNNIAACLENHMGIVGDCYIALRFGVGYIATNMNITPTNVSVWRNSFILNIYILRVGVRNIIMFS